MTDPDPHPDSLPAADHDDRSDIERAVEGENRDIENVQGGDTSPLEPSGVPDGVGGTGGVTKNQDRDAQ
ncbi:hypothetical protein [Sphingomonas japonica]|uniref:Uncharacterized protein n=1 Tax=Sphingomonas japonica TaxID=511662 RepID=A0ABX0U3G4_9SPHN|nr:hypothetical protein [Sphingomonas japonica]NIJ25103.1 hypothetical protein [Sphingomonas japonica]